VFEKIRRALPQLESFGRPQLEWDVVIARILFVLAATIAIMIDAKVAEGHSWYDWECCSGEDCMVVERMEYKDNKTYFYTKKYDFPIVMENSEVTKKAKASKDADWHICVVIFENDEKKVTGHYVRCVYIPGTS
jgi:hypothetical protein